MRLYVDDRRPKPQGWECTESITKAIHWLSMGIVDEISLDFDCGLENESYAAVACYIAAMPVDLRPKKIHIHTDNPAGRKLLNEILFEKDRDTDNGT